MNKDKTFQFQQRWVELEKKQANLDFERSVLAKDIRAEFPAGELGDQAFINWCDIELNLPAAGAKELLTRATAVQIVPDAKTWNQVGGYRSIRHLQDLPKREQVNVLESAKSTGRAILNIVKERGLGPKLPELAPPPPRPTTPYRPPLREVDHDSDASQEYRDCVALVKYLAKNGKNLPREILAIMARYSSPAVSRRRAG